MRGAGPRVRSKRRVVRGEGRTAPASSGRRASRASSPRWRAGPNTSEERRKVSVVRAFNELMDLKREFRCAGGSVRVRGDARLELLHAGHRHEQRHDRARRLYMIRAGVWRGLARIGPMGMSLGLMKHWRAWKIEKSSAASASAARSRSDGGRPGVSSQRPTRQRRIAVRKRSVRRAKVPVAVGREVKNLGPWRGRRRAPEATAN